MKKVVISLITLLLLIGTTYLVAHYAHAKFVDYAFFVGIVFSVLIRIFTSKGGFLTNSANMTLSNQFLGVSVKEITGGESQMHMKIQPSLAFVISVLYTVISLIAMIVVYGKYFF